MKKLVLLLISVLAVSGARAGVNYANPAGGWSYIYNGDQTNPLPSVVSKPNPCLDGTWNGNNGSSEWDGSWRGAGNGKPGGISSDGNILTIEDVDAGSGSLNNRKLYFEHPMWRENLAQDPVNILDTGITLTFRARLSPPEIQPAAELSNLPRGWGIFSDGKGQFGAHEYTYNYFTGANAHNQVSFSFVTTNTPGPNFNFSAPGLTFNRNNGDTPSGGGAANSTTNATVNPLIPLDVTQFHEVWVTIQASDGATSNGTHRITIYLDGDTVGQSFPVTAGTGNDGETLTNASFISMGHNNSSGASCYDIDFFGYKQGVVTPTLQTAAPARPANLVAANSDTRVALSWTEAPDPGAEAYIIKRATTSGGPYTIIATNTLTSYRDTDVVNGQYYYYVVAAYNRAGVSADSLQATGHPQNAPQNVVARGGTNQVALSWSSMAVASSYNVKRSSTPGGPYTNIASSVTATSYLDAGLPAGQSFYYVVSGNLTAGGEGANSDEVSAVTAPNTPTNLTAQLFAATAARLNWDTADLVTPTNLVQLSTDGTTFTTIAVIPGTARPYMAGNLALNTTNYFRVYATNAGGFSAVSSVALVVTPSWGINVNFANATNGQPANNLAATPPGYLQDRGYMFADQGNGYSYGWDIDNTANGRWRQNAASPDLRYDTFNHMQKQTPAAMWEIAIPNGLYTVRIVAGDPSNTDALFQFDTEGYLTKTFDDTATAHWGDFTNTVRVNDGRLTIKTGPLAVNDKIDFVDIYAAVPTPNTIATNPASARAIQNQPVSFSVAVAPGGPEPYGFQWYFAGNALANANGSTLTLTTPQLTDAGQYFVVVTNAGAAATSTVAVLTVDADTVPPQVLSAGSIDGTSVGIAFNEFVDPTTALDYSRYTVNGQPVQSSLRPDGKSVLLALGTPVTGTFNVTVTGMKDLAGNTAAAQTVSGTVLGYTGEDLGGPGFPGAGFTADGLNIELAGGGADIWGISDQGYYVHRSVNGDFDARARVVSLVGVNAITKALLVVRETMDPADRNIHISVNPVPPGRNLAETGIRDTYAGSTVVLGSTYTPANIPDFWMRIVRVGDTFTTFRSANGVDWIQFGQTNQTYLANLQLALAVTAHDNLTQATGVFSNFAVSAPLGDLVVAMSASPASAAVGGTVSFNITVTNAGLVSASGATLTDTLPAGLTYVSGTSTSGSVSEAGGVVTASLGTLTPGAGALVQIVASVTAPGTKINSVAGTITGGDANPGNNTASATVSVLSTPVITSPVLSSGTFRFSFATDTGITYAAQYKDHLTDPDWTTLQVINGTGSVVEVRDTTPAPGQRFYRIIIQ